VTLAIRAAYTADPELVMAILRDMAKAHPKTLADPSPVALCTGFGESGLNFEVRVWTARTEDAETLLSQLAVSVHRALTAAKIEIAFPQREVHIRNTDDRLPIASASSGLTS
jgi:potassium efflux system protein